MTLTITTAPAVEPVTLDEVKTRLRVDTTDDDTLITALITAQRQRIETLTGQALITRSVTEARDIGPADGVLTLAVGPVSAVTEVAAVDEDGARTTLDAASYLVDTASIPGRIALVTGASWPVSDRAMAGFEIAYDAGYGGTADDTPAPLREAIFALVADAYEHRVPTDRADTSDERAMPPVVAGLIAPYQRVRL